MNNSRSRFFHLQTAILTIQPVSHPSRYRWKEPVNPVEDRNLPHGPVGLNVPVISSAPLFQDL